MTSNMSEMGTSSRIKFCCPECESKDIIKDKSGTLICSECGLVIDDLCLDISHPENRFYTREDYRKKARTGQPITDLTPNMVFLTTFNKNETKKPKFNRMFRWNNQVRWSERAKLLGVSEIKRIGNKLGIPRTAQADSLNMFKKLADRRLLKGRSIHGMVSACLYIQCKNHKVPILGKDIINFSKKLDRSKLTLFTRIIVDKLNTVLPPTDPATYISRFSDELDLDLKAEDLIKKILSKLQQIPMYMAGKDPFGVLAGVFYFVSKVLGHNKTQNQIKEVMDVTEVTIRSRYQEIVEFIKSTYSKKRKLDKKS